jgi:hypothetical protein
MRRSPSLTPRPVDLFTHPDLVHICTRPDGTRWATDRVTLVRLTHPTPTVLDGLAGLDDGVWEIRAVKPPTRLGDTTASLGQVLERDWSSAQAVYPWPGLMLAGHSEQTQYRPLVTSPEGHQAAAVVDGRLWTALTGATPYPPRAEFLQIGTRPGAGVVRVLVEPPRGEPYAVGYVGTILLGAPVNLPVIPEGVLG